MRLTKWLIFRCLSATGDAATARITPSSTLAPSALASSTGACAKVSSADVIAAARTIATATALQHAARQPVPSVVTDPADFATFAAATMPRGPLIASASHPMIPVEFATFRAARLVATAGLPVATAISACR